MPNLWTTLDPKTKQFNLFLSVQNGLVWFPIQSNDPSAIYITENMIKSLDEARAAAVNYLYNLKNLNNVTENTNASKSAD